VAANDAAPAAASQAAAAAPHAVASGVAMAPATAAASAAELAVPAFPPDSLAASAVAPAELTGSLQLRVTGESWVEVLDASGAALLQRLLQPGEAVGLDGTPPFKLKVGNAAAVQLSFRGQVVDLKAVTRDNVARIELK
jgi:cytoskeleton protein RodZ